MRTIKNGEFSVFKINFEAKNLLKIIFVFEYLFTCLVSIISNLIHCQLNNLVKVCPIFVGTRSSCPTRSFRMFIWVVKSIEFYLKYYEIPQLTSCYCATCLSLVHFPNVQTRLSIRFSCFENGPSKNNALLIYSFVYCEIRGKQI